jgi:hypothetical protein
MILKITLTELIFSSWNLERDTNYERSHDLKV